MKYYCTNNECTSSDEMPYNLQLNMESILDENNLGAFFCPHCQHVLERSEIEPLLSVA